MAARPRPRLPAIGRLTRGLAMPVASVVFAFVIGALIVLVTGGDPLAAYAGLICGGFGIDCTQGENPALQLSNTIVFTIPLITAGIAVARLYHVLESPSEFFADPWPLLISRFGFAWFGGFLGGFAALLILSWREKIPTLTFLDACSPAACVGYALGRIGCLLSGDGDYGIPTSHPWGMSFPNGVVPTTETCLQQGWPADCRVHPTPIYEFFIWMVIAYILWRLGESVIRHKKPAGLVFCAYLVLTGIARFLVEIIRLNPRSFFGMSNAQAASALSVIFGVILYLLLVRNVSTNRAAVGL